MDAQQGRQLGSQYRLSERLGRGSMGEVWSGTDRAGHRFAFKLLHEDLVENRDLVRRFFDEQALLKTIRHPNVVAVHDLVLDSGTLAIVMDLVDGEDLRHHLRHEATLPPAEASRIGAQIASGLAAIHEARIVHRDVKPENVLLDAGDRGPVARLTDLGVAKAIEESGTLPGTTMLTGTPKYMAPEIVAGDAPSPATDMYALGLVLYEMLAGTNPFDGLTAARLLRAHLAFDPGRPVGIDDDMWRLIIDLVSKDPHQRPDAQLTAAALRDFSRSKLGRPALPVRRPVAPTPAPAEYRVSDPSRGETVVWAESASEIAASVPRVIPRPEPPAGLTAAEPERQNTVLYGVICGLLLALIVGLLGTYLLIIRPQAGGSTTVTAAAGNATTKAGKAPGSSGPRQGASQEPFPPSGGTLCSGYDDLAVDATTSCPFAVNVRTQFLKNPGAGPYSVQSPTTGATYSVSCTVPTHGDAYVCAGGSNAVVYIRH